MLNLKQKFFLIYKNKRIIWNLTRKLIKNSGRIRGKISIRHRGGGKKNKIRIIDIFRSLWNIKGLVQRFEYDPLRNTLIVLVAYSCGILSYIIAVENLLIGNIILNGIKIPFLIGNNTCLKLLKIGTKINCLENILFNGAKLLRSSGVYGKILKKVKYLTLIKLKSNKIISVNSFCTATIGIIFNFNYFLFRYKKAGYTRLKNKKPTVRGVAMNPIDHPHGGGEGKKSKKKICMSPWGRLIKGKKTSKKY